MGFFDKLKGAMNAITGGAAKVTIEIAAPCIFPGEEVPVRVTATSTGAEVKSGGCFVDVWAHESVKVHDSETKKDLTQSKTTIEQTFQIAPAFVLGANETKVFEGIFRLPPTVLPTYTGTFAQHACSLRGRIEAFGNDPDSGFVPVRVGAKG